MIKKKKQRNITSNEKNDIITYAVDCQKVREYDKHYFNKLKMFIFNKFENKISINLKTSPRTSIARFPTKLIFSNLNSVSKCMSSVFWFKEIKLNIFPTTFNIKVL